MAVRASSSAASGVCTPLRPKPVSHSTRNGTSTPPARAPSEIARATTSLSNTTASRRSRRVRATSRSTLARPITLNVSSTSSATPASVKTSTSPSFWQVMPTAPAAICMRPSAGILWVFTCGRLAMPSRARWSWTRRMLRSTMSRRTVTAGVSSSVTRVIEWSEPRTMRQRQASRRCLSGAGGWACRARGLARHSML